MKVATGTVVTFSYQLRGADGEIVEESSDGDPVRYAHGSEEILPALEQALEGAEPGAELQVELSAQLAYGEFDPSGIVSVPRGELPTDAELEPGDWLTVTVERQEEDDDGEEGDIDMRIVEIDGDAIVLDANHPLAGQDVTFNVRIESVESSS